MGTSLLRFYHHYLIILSSFTVNNSFDFLVNKLREFLQQPYTFPELDTTYTSNFHEKFLKIFPTGVKRLVA